MLQVLCWRTVFRVCVPGVTQKNAPSPSLISVLLVFNERPYMHHKKIKNKKKKWPSFLLPFPRGGPSQITFPQIESLVAETDRKQVTGPHSDKDREGRMEP